MSSETIVMFGLSFFLTILIELSFGFLWGIRTKKGILLLFLVNLLTNPAAVFLTWAGRIIFSLENTIYLQYMIEIVVIIVEGILYKVFSQKDDWKIRCPVLFAVLANVISWSTGVILQWIW